MRVDGHRIPAWQVTLDGQDITGRIAPRLLSLSIRSERAKSADQLDLSVSDHDGRLALPTTGVLVDVSLGWKDTGLTRMGSFVVDEVEHTGTPDKVTIRARSAAVARAWRQKRDQSWHNILLGDMIRSLAGRNGLTPRCAPSLAGIRVDHIDQTNESDLNILTRIGKLWDAVATVKAGCLLFAPIGAGKTARGLGIPAITVQRGSGDQHRYHAADREAYTGVRAYWQDVQAAKRQQVVVGKETALKTLRKTYATQADALAGARAEWNRVQRGKATFSLQLAQGRADIYPDMPATVSGFKPDIDAIAWLTKSVEHRLDDSGFTTHVECENANAQAPEIQS